MVNPDKVQARKMVLVGILLLAIIGVYRDRKQTDPAGTFRVMWAAGVVGLLLTLLADFAPKIAGPFALLAVLGSLTRDNVIERALGTVAPTKSTGSGSGTSTRSASSPAPSATPTPAGG